MKSKQRKSKGTAQSRELDQAWQDLLQRHAAPLERGARAWGMARAESAKQQSHNVRRTSELDSAPSVDTGGGNTAKIDHPVYTGDQMIGITVLHKSCLQPVFNQQAAIDAATMRRN